MCGFFFAYDNSNKLSPIEIKAYKKAVSSLSHRGPDGSGWKAFDNCILGHRRLSILDLSNQSAQPMSSPDNRFHLAFNGEIYNYLELRKELERHGFKFFSTGDTEVLLNAIIFWGLEAFDKLDGMFAGVFFDNFKNEVLFFRDRLGQKPLYYSQHEGKFLCASELRALIISSKEKLKLSKPNFYKFLMCSYYGETTTAIEGVKKLEPGCVAVISGANIRFERFHHSEPSDAKIYSTNEFSTALSQFEVLLDQSIEKTMRTDVPFGIFLSGGIDSTLIYERSKRINQKISSFSVSFEDVQFDETYKVREVLSKHEASNHDYFRLSTEEAVSCIGEVLQKFDEPHGDPGFYNSYFLARKAIKHVKVALSGDGGDELFAGYSTFGAITPARLVTQTGLPLNFLKFLTSNIPTSNGYMNLSLKANAFVNGLPFSEVNSLKKWLGTLSSERLNALSLYQAPENIYFNEHMLNSSTGLKTSTIQAFLLFYQRIFLPEFVCAHTDRASMLNGMEVRAPLLSKSLIEFSNGLPDQFKFNGKTGKLLLRSYAEKLGFEDSFFNQKKQGFTFPVSKWLRTALRSKLDDLLNREEWHEEGLIDFEVLSELKSEHLSGKRDNHRILLNLMAFRGWRRHFQQVGI